MALVRETEPGTHNLAVGEPFFLQEVYKSLYPFMSSGTHKVTYPPLRGDAELIEAIRGYSQVAGLPGRHIVVTNGAKQGLLASMYAHQAVSNAAHLFHQPPFWPTYPTLAKLSGLKFDSQQEMSLSGTSISVLTSPNNPDGATEGYESGLVWDIWDAAYASPIYGWAGVAPLHHMAVLSAAKLFGVSGYRIGWVVTEDEELARYAAEYVEKTTSGVSMLSQAFLRGLLWNLSKLSRFQLNRMEATARESLKENSKEFMKLAPLFGEVKGFPDSGSGMFAWVHPHQPSRFRQILALAKVKAVGGEFCGSTEDWVRISLGVTNETMVSAVKAIQEAESHG